MVFPLILFKIKEKKKDYSAEKFVSDKCRMDFLKFGSGDRNLIIIPALNVKSILTMADVIVQGNSIFSKNGFSVYVFDRREDASYPYSIEQMASDTFYVLKELALENIFLYGHSQGGMLAQSMVLQEQERINKVIFSSTVSHLNGNAKAVLTKWIDFAQHSDVQGLYDDFEKTIFSEGFARIAHQAMMDEVKTVTDDELRNFIPHTENMFSFDVTDKLEKIKTDSFVIGSKADKVFDYELVKELAEKSHSKSFFFENADTVLLLNPQNIIRGFLIFF